MSEATFCRAVGNGRLMTRLRAGRTPKKGKPVRLWPETEMQVRAFMMAERRKREREVA